MNGTNSRRGFLKGFGLFSAVAAGAATSHFANTSTSMAIWDSVDPVLVPPVDYSLAPTGQVNLTLTADNVRPTAVHYHPSTSTFMASDNAKQNNVKMSVGLDDRLWIEVDGKWRRVALEG